MIYSYVQEIVEERDPEDYALSMDIENTEPHGGIQTRVRHICLHFFQDGIIMENLFNIN